MNGCAVYFRASSCSVVDFTNYTLASMQKVFSNRGPPVGEGPAHYKGL